MNVHTISSINLLTHEEKREIITRLIPPELIERFDLSPDLFDPQGNDLLAINANPGSTVAEMRLYHQDGFPDPVLYGHITDTLAGQLHILLYILNDPASPRFDVDRLPDGTSTRFGTLYRNKEAELAAMQFSLSPGQVRRGLRMLGEAIIAFESFVTSLGHELYFVEPLYYHNAIIFERFGFTYQKGKRLMQHIQEGFSANGDLIARLDGSTPFRMPTAANSIRLRSWAIHDGLLGSPFTDVTMYKRVGKSAEVNTCPDCNW
ncbi:MAG: hypothetical protein JXB15_00740 [Anaerolineales bacterium]|nr:hypothetical protein [Anaerolineales bacterium]